MTDKNQKHERKGSVVGWIVFLGAGAGVFGLGVLAGTINDRKEEARNSRVQFMSPIDEWESDNSKWGQSFPREFNSWEATKEDSEKTKYGGSAFSDHLEDRPNLVLMWAGYGFAKEYNAPRGHYYAVKDAYESERTGDKSPGTCWTCKSPDVPRVMNENGVGEFYAGNFMELHDEINNPIGCADCHDNETMALRISRPALIEAYERQGKDITKSSHQEMRSLVCAQCHVEYYFKGKEEKYLTFPWDDGDTIEDMEAYYDKVGHVDWTHSISGAKMIKMQHPDYEMYKQGIHAFRDVSCADCHMPYKSEGGIKFTDHQIRSPLQNVANSCQVCHRWSEKDIIGRVTGMQDNHMEMLKRIERSIVFLHLEIGDAIKLGATDAELAESRDKVRRAQMYWDYVAANNGVGFHAPQESARVLDKALEFSTDGRLLINRIRADYGVNTPITLPDIGSKDKAQAYIAPFVTAAKAAAASTPVKTS